MKLARKLLYYALWPVEIAVRIAEHLGHLLWMLIIVSNPLFLAIYLMSRRHRDPEQEDLA